MWHFSCLLLCIASLVSANTLVSVTNMSPARASTTQKLAGASLPVTCHVPITGSTVSNDVITCFVVLHPVTAFGEKYVDSGEMIPMVEQLQDQDTPYSVDLGAKNLPDGYYEFYTQCSDQTGKTVVVDGGFNPAMLVIVSKAAVGQMYPPSGSTVSHAGTFDFTVEVYEDLVTTLATPDATLFACNFMYRLLAVAPAAPAAWSTTPMTYDATAMGYCENSATEMCTKSDWLVFKTTIDIKNFPTAGVAMPHGTYEFSASCTSKNQPGVVTEQGTGTGHFVAHQEDGYFEATLQVVDMNPRAQLLSTINIGEQGCCVDITVDTHKSNFVGVDHSDEVSCFLQYRSHDSNNMDNQMDTVKVGKWTNLPMAFVTGAAELAEWKVTFNAVALGLPLGNYEYTVFCQDTSNTVVYQYDPNYIGTSTIQVINPHSQPIEYVRMRYPLIGAELAVTRPQSCCVNAQVEVYKMGVTDQMSSAADHISCVWSYRLQGTTGAWIDSPLKYASYNEADGTNLYKGLVDVRSIAVGTYEFTSSCTDRVGTVAASARVDMGAPTTPSTVVVAGTWTDFSAPVLTMAVSSTKYHSAMLVVTLDEAASVWCHALPIGSPAPTVLEIEARFEPIVMEKGSNPATNSIEVSGLKDGLQYETYCVAQDLQNFPNMMKDVQAIATKMKFLTRPIKCPDPAAEFTKHNVVQVGVDGCKPNSSIGTPCTVQCAPGFDQGDFPREQRTADSRCVDTDPDHDLADTNAQGAYRVTFRCVKPIISNVMDMTPTGGSLVTATLDGPEVQIAASVVAAGLTDGDGKGPSISCYIAYRPACDAGSAGCDWKSPQLLEMEFNADAVCQTANGPVECDRYEGILNPVLQQIPVAQYEFTTLCKADNTLLQSATPLKVQISKGGYVGNHLPPAITFAKTASKAKSVSLYFSVTEDARVWCASTLDLGPKTTPMLPAQIQAAAGSPVEATVANVDNNVFTVGNLNPITKYVVYCVAENKNAVPVMMNARSVLNTMTPVETTEPSCAAPKTLPRGVVVVSGCEENGVVGAACVLKCGPGFVADSEKTNAFCEASTSMYKVALTCSSTAVSSGVSTLSPVSAIFSVCVMALVAVFAL